MTSEILISTKLSQLEDEALPFQHLQHTVLFLAWIPKKSNTLPLATHSFCHSPRPAHLPQSFTVSVDQLCGRSWVWCLGLQTDKVFSEQRKANQLAYRTICTTTLSITCFHPLS